MGTNLFMFVFLIGWSSATLDIRRKNDIMPRSRWVGRGGSPYYGVTRCGLIRMDINFSDTPRQKTVARSCPVTAEVSTVLLKLKPHKNPHGRNLVHF